MRSLDSPAMLHTLRAIASLLAGVALLLLGSGLLNTLIPLRGSAAVVSDVSRRSGGAERRMNSPQSLAQAVSRMVTMIGARYEVTYLRPAGATAASLLAPARVARCLLPLRAGSSGLR